MIRILIVAVAVAIGTAGVTAALSQADPSSPGPAVQLENGRLDDAMVGLDPVDDEKGDDGKDNKAGKDTKASVATRDGNTFKAAPVVKPVAPSTRDAKPSPSAGKSHDDTHTVASHTYTYTNTAVSITRPT